MSPVAVAMLEYLPLPDTDRDNGSTNYTRTSRIKSNFSQLYSVKLEHKFTDNVSLSGFYLYNSTNEPEANFFGTADQTEPTRFADPNDYYLRRRPQILALNNTWVLSNTSVLALRFGKTEFPDNDTLTIDFDPRSLPFSTTYKNQIQLDKFPQVRIRGYDQGHGSRTLGAINPTEINWKSTSANATLSKVAGAHTFKFGGDWRKMGIDTFIPGDGAGFFDFDKDMTSSDGGIGSTTNGNAFASFLLGYPSARTDRVTSLSVSTPLNVFTHYFGGYAQDDWRVSSKFTLNYGLRLEHEKGLSEKDNNFTVGFDPAMQSALSTVTIPADPVAGTPARTVTGGLMYAGVDGNKTYQGNAPAVKWSPRVGAVYSLNDRTVLRGGYGLYWAPFNYPIPSTSASNYGQVGYSQNTILTSSRSNPTTFENPFPNGIELPSGNTPRRADEPRQQHQLRRSEPDGAARAAVLGRPAARAAREHGAHRELHGRAQRSHRPRRVERHRREHQPARSEVPRARFSGARRAAAQPVPRTTRTCRGRCRRRRRCRGPACCGRSRSTARSTPGRSPKASAATTPA